MTAERYVSENVFFQGAQSVYVYNSLADFYTDANGYIANPNRTTAAVQYDRFQVGYSNIPELDPLIESLASETDEAERARTGNEIDVILWEYGHTIPLYQRPDLIAVNANLANYGALGLSDLKWEDNGWMS